MGRLKCTGGRKFGVASHDPNVTFSYGCWLRRNALLGRICANEFFRVPRFAFSVGIMRSVSHTCFFSSPSHERYGIDGGRLGVMASFMLILLLNSGIAWVDLLRRLLSCRWPGWWVQSSFSGTFGWNGIARFFVMSNLAALNYGS